MNTPALLEPIPFLQRLRSRTRAEHEAIEAALGLAGPALTRAAYRARLARFLGFYRPLEARLAACRALSEAGLDLDVRRKSPLLAADLAALGIADPSRLPDCEDLPPLDDAFACFGCMYVLEGATLGGRILAPRVQAVLGLTAATGVSFHEGYGPRTGAMWQAFRAALAAYADTDARQERVVAAAIETFRRLRLWCTERGP